MSTAALETYVDLSRTRLETMLKVLDVDGAVDRVRGGWTGHRAGLGLRPGALRPGRRRPTRRAGRDAGLHRHRRLPDAVPARAARRPRRRRLRALRQLRRRSPCPPTISGAAVEQAGERLRRPGVTMAPAQDVADRAGQPRHRAQGQDRRGRRGRAAPSAGSPTSATARRCASCSGPDAEDGAVPRALVDAVARGARRLAPGLAGPPDRGGVRRVGPPTPAAPATSPTGLARYLKLPLVAPLARSSTLTSRRARAQPTPPSGSPRSTVASTSPSTSPSTAARCCSSTTSSSTGWTLTLAARALRTAGASAVLPLDPRGRVLARPDSTAGRRGGAGRGTPVAELAGRSNRRPTPPSRRETAQ